MPHQNVHSPQDTAQNTVTPSRDLGDALQGELDLRFEPRSYASTDLAQSTLAAPAAGEMPDDMDEGDALDDPGVQEGARTPAAPCTPRPTAAKVGRPSPPTAR